MKSLNGSNIKTKLVSILNKVVFDTHTNAKNIIESAMKQYLETAIKQKRLCGYTVEIMPYKGNNEISGTVYYKSTKKSNFKLVDFIVRPSK